MKRISGIIALIFLLLTTGACSDGQQTTEKRPATVAARKVAASAPAGQDKQAAPIFRTIPAREAQALMAARQDLLVVDLREANELREGYIAGSQLIPMSAIAKGTKSLPADKPLLLLCAVGGRSLMAGQYFSRKGYPEIYNLQGGISAWKRAGLPLQY